MDLKEYPDWHDVVRSNWKKTTAFLLSFSEPCITIQAQELEAIRRNRVLVGLDAASLEKWTPPASWMMAVVLFPGDDVGPLLAWMHRHEADPDRIHFYAHPTTDAFTVLAPWAKAGLPFPKVDEDMATWVRLHKRFGLDLSVQILKDWS